MNLNDITAQQQAFLNQVLQSQQHVTLGLLVFWVAGILIWAFVIYMFYARLRDISNELMKLRVAYEFAHTPEARSRASQEGRREPAWPQPPKPLLPSAEDQKYMPKG